ncbi:hypothetical protein BGZ98_000943, partial [Dissophora globulifera]
MTRLWIIARIAATLFLVASSHCLPPPATASAVVNLTLTPVAPTLQSVSTTGCRNHPGGGKCPEFAPCCLNGYCSDMCNDKDEDTEFNNPRLANVTTFNGNPNEYDLTTDYNADSVVVQDSKLKITMKLDSKLNAYGRPQGLGSVVSTTRFMQYGKVTARMKTGSSSPGVVSAFIIRNEDPGDEIDFEIVGRDPTEAQTNFYYRTPPDMLTNLIDYTGKESLNTNTAAGFHEYEIEWMPDYLLWKVDGKVVRSVFKNETKDDIDLITGAPVVDPRTGKHVKKYPSTPAKIQFGIWDGGQGSEGTGAWAGTPTDWSKPGQTYEVQVDSLDIQCFYQGNETVTWPPKGYGPTKTHSGPYFTPGLDGGWSLAADDVLKDEKTPTMAPYVPFYKNPNLMIPTACLLGIALIAIAVVEVTKRRRLKQ